MKRFLLVGLLALLATSESRADVIAEWNFNGESSSTVPGGVNAPTASTALTVASASAVGGVVPAATFSSGTASGGSSDPVITTPTNYGWQTSTYPAQGTADRTAGVQFNVSTSGYSNILISWDTRASNTSARHQQFQYALDGTSFVDFGSLFENTIGDTWFNNRQIDLSSISGANDNPNFAFRLVSAFDPATGNSYTASNSPTSTYAATGTLRFDMVTVEGTSSAIPEPTALALLSAAGIGVVIRRRASRNHA